MKDWKLLAEGAGFDIPTADLDRIAPVLAALEAAFRPLVQSIPPDVEPAVIFACTPEDIR